MDSTNSEVIVDEDVTMAEIREYIRHAKRFIRENRPWEAATQLESAASRLRIVAKNRRRGNDHR